MAKGTFFNDNKNTVGNFILLFQRLETVTYLKPKKSSMFADLVLGALLGLENQAYVETYGTLGTDVCSSLTISQRLILE